MKLCFLANLDDNHCRKWIGYFAERGHDVHVLSRPSGHLRELERSNITFHPLRASRLKFLEVAINVVRARKLIRDIQPDILHALYAGVSGMLGALSGFHPFALTAFGSDILLNARSPFTRPFIRFMVNRADRVTCNGQTLFNGLLALGVGAPKIKFVYWGTDTEKFRPGPRSARIRERFKIGDAPLVISLRNLEPIYDVETLLKAIPVVLREVNEAKFLIAGDGSQRKKLEEVAERLGIAGSALFVGWLPEDELHEYLNSADVYVSTSRSDGDLSQSTQQAMACEVPVVITDLAVNKKRVRDGSNGLLFPSGSHILLAQKIIKLLKDKELRTILGRAGRKTIVSDLDYRKNMKEAEKLYEEFARCAPHNERTT